MMQYLNSHKILKYFLYTLLGLVVIGLLAWQVAVYRAAALFNAAMSKQDIFKGKIEAESIDCDLSGNIKFVNLNWKTDTNQTIVRIPKGRISINPEDMLAFRINPNTIRELVLEDADLRLLFNDRMKLEVLVKEKSDQEVENGAKQEAEKQIVASKVLKQDAQKTPARIAKNLNLPEQLPNWRIVLKNCRVAAKHKQKLYVMEKVNCSLKIAQHRKMELDFSSGKLGGTMVGDGVTLKGKGDLVSDQGNYELAIKNVVPRSLGLGKLSDPVNIQGQLTGTHEEPTLTGVIKFNTLDLHRMVFTKVSSDFRYNQGIAHFTNTVGNIWGGYVKAQGRYHFDSHRYRIDGEAFDLDLPQVTNREDIVGRGNLNFQLLCDPKARRQVVKGSYEIGHGHFKLLHFKRITGEAFCYNKVSYLKNIKVVTSLLTVTKHAIKIEDSKVDTSPELPDEAAIIGDLAEI